MHFFHHTTPSPLAFLTAPDQNTVQAVSPRFTPWVSIVQVSEFSTPAALADVHRVSLAHHALLMAPSATEEENNKEACM